MTPLAGLDRVQLSAALQEAGADAWLLYDFRGINPIAGRVLGVGGMATRRLFVLLPREGDPVAVAHRIELQGVAGFPGRVVPYARWEELHAALGSLVADRTVAMEISPEDAVPYLDRVPFGVVELVRRLGGRVVPSGPLVSRFAAAWSAAETAGHLAAAETIATIARGELARTVREPGVSESAVQARVVRAFHDHHLVFEHPPIVAFGPNAANPHYEPIAGQDARLVAGQVVLLDLWAAPKPDAVSADQTWIGFAGNDPPPRVRQVWEVVREARDAAIGAVRDAARTARPIAAYEADRAARGVVERAGFGQWFVHRTGHSIDRDLHGSGPNLDDYETHDDRRLGPGIGFSVEPGIYLPGEFGIRSEVNMFWGQNGPEVTPKEPQRELITA